MNQTKKYEFTEDTLTVTMDRFIELIGAGRVTADRIATEAEAKVYCGKRLLINIDKVKKYLDLISE